MRLFSSVLAIASLAVMVAASLPAIEVVGNKFFDANGNQFFIKGAIALAPVGALEVRFTDPRIGIAYQLTPGWCFR